MFQSQLKVFFLHVSFEYVSSLMINYKCILTFLRTSVQLARLSVA